MNNKKLLETLFILILLISSCNNNELTISDIKIDDEYACTLIADIEGVKYLNSDKFNGSCASYRDGVKTEILSYKDGISEGIHVGYYFPEGSIDYIGYRKNGEIDGKFTKFHKNGEKAVVGKFRNGIFIGDFKYYDSLGKLFETKKFDNYGKLWNTIKHE